jgi:alcohol dehydrogenase
MMMQQLTFIAPGKLEWRDAPMPVLKSDSDAIVRPLAVARCDLDYHIVTGRLPFPGPFAFGHEMVGEVIDAGPQANVAPGTRVIVPFQLSCGRCDSCRHGWTNSCSAFPPYAGYGLAAGPRPEFGGGFSDAVHVPFADHMLVPIPDAVDNAVAANISDNIADGWRGVAGPLKQRPGASVLVIGGLAQSVGLYAVAAAAALGAGRVTYLDDEAGRRRRAEALGAHAAPLAFAEGQRHDQYEIVVEAAGDAAALAFAIQSTAPNGILTVVSIHLGTTTPVPLHQAYYKGVTIHTGRVQSRASVPDVLACIACGALKSEPVTHRTARFAEAAEAMDDPGPKIVFLAD